jgi:hypothetical protein
MGAQLQQFMSVCQLFAGWNRNVYIYFRFDMEDREAEDSEVEDDEVNGNESEGKIV